MSKKLILCYILIFVLIILGTLAVNEYRDWRIEVEHIRTELRKQEFEISDLKAQIRLLKEIGVEIGRAHV